MKNRSKFLTSTLLAAAAMSFCTTSANAADLTWEGIDDNNSWDGVSNNWSGDSKFSSGDSATSDDTEESSEEVPVEEEEITAGTIEIGSVDGTGGETTFGGSGSITIFATYSDVMWLTTTYEDDVYVTSGTMEISDGETIFKGGVYVGGGSLGEDGSITIAGGTTTFNDSVSVSGGYMANGSITITGGETTFNNSVSVTGATLDGDGSITITGGETTFKDSVSVAGGYMYSDGLITITGGETTFEGSVSVSGGSVDSDGSITITGGTTTFEGIVSVSGSGSGSGIFSRSAGSLSLTGGTITLYYAISNSGTVTVGENVVFVLNDALITTTGDTTTYTLISGDGTIYGWDSLSASNFSLNGKMVSERSTIDVTTAGQVTINYVDAANLVWNGTGADNVWTETRNEGAGSENKIWKNSEEDDYFYSYDNVTFGSNGEKTVSISGKIEAGTVTVTDSSSYTFTFSEDSSVTADSLTINSGASLTLAGSGELTTSSATISGNLEITSGEATITSVEISSEGSLTISGGETTFESSVTVAEGSSLSLTGGTVTLSEAISNSGTVTLGDNVVFVLDNLTPSSDDETTTYTIISSDGTICDWGTLTNSNFSLNGSTLEHSSLDLSVAGQVTIITIGWDLVWNGTSSNNVWTNSRDEIWTDSGTEDSDYFSSYDNVTFGTDGTKSVTISGAIVAGTVDVTGAGYTFSFDADSSLTADSLTIHFGASLEIKDGTTTIEGTVTVAVGSSLAISGGTTTAGSIVIGDYGSIELTGGELTVNTIELYSGSGSFSGGILNVGNIADVNGGSLYFGDGLTVNLYETTSLSIGSAITLSGSVTFNAEEGESIELSGTLSGSGKLVKDGDGTLTLSGDNTFSGGTTISSGTVVAQSENALGTGAVAIDSGATLELAASGTFSNATSGNGTLSITNNAIVSFGSNVGVKNVNVASGATLSGATTLTSDNATLDLAGTLALDVSAGEQVSFTNGGTVILESSATLNLSGISPTSIKPLSDSSTLGAGSSITIFSGATIEGDIEDFLKTDSTLSALPNDYAVVYDPSKGLTVTILESGSVSSLTSGVRLHDGIGSSFISAIISDDDLDFGAGFKSTDDLSNPIVKALATGNISEASKMMDTLAPNDYAAMVAMPTTSFYNDVKAIDNRLAARRGPLDENARWEFFAQAQGTFVENDDASDTQTFDFDLYGVLAGADYRVNEGLTVGVTVGYDYGKADIHNSGGKIESDDVRITVFAGQQIGEMFFVNAGAQVGYGHYEAKRKTALGNANGDTDGWNAGLFADVGMMLTISEELKIAARPYVGLAYLHSEVGSFDDNIFDVDDFHGDSLRASIGCGLFWGFDLAEAAWTVGLDASYSHDFCGDEVDIDATYMSTDKDFGITAKALSKDIFSVGPTVSVGITKSIDIFAGYAFQAGTDSSTGHNVNAGLKVTF